MGFVWDEKYFDAPILDMKLALIPLPVGIIATISTAWEARGRQVALLSGNHRNYLLKILPKRKL